MPAQLISPRAQEYLVLLSAVLIRVLVGLSSYSGENDPPKYGDYEAQRHWMEITTNLPFSEWYSESLHNNFTYWPLDYPPLSGYQSWVHGQFVKHYEPAAVELITSHGYETPTSKKLMRATVLLSDILIFFPAAIAVTRMLYGPKPSNKRAFSLACLLLNPALTIIDHGHFQYNCISLGLALGAAAAIGNGWQLLGSFLFCAALNHKQMTLYYAPAFFAHLLGRSFQQRGFHRKVGNVILLGITVILSFGLIWAPWATHFQSAEQVLRRIFPLKRGLYEDYVANWWCTSSVAIKWKQILYTGTLLVFSWAKILPADTLVMLCGVVTLVGAVPSMAQQIWRPSSKGLLMNMANSAASFFMFSYQVHEKSVLLPLLPVMAMAADEPTAAAWMPLISMVSMFPLLERDGLTLPYIGLILIWGGLMLAWSPVILAIHKAAVVTVGSPDAKQSSFVIGFVWLSGIGFTVASIALHVVQKVVAPPEHLPWLYDRGFITLGFAGLSLIMLYLQLAQWRLQPQITTNWFEHDATVIKKRL